LNDLALRPVQHSLWSGGRHWDALHTGKGLQGNVGETSIPCSLSRDRPRVDVQTSKQINHLDPGLVQRIIVPSLRCGAPSPGLFVPMSSTDSSPSVRYLTVDENSSGQRLDNFLIRELKGVPKTHIYRIIRSGEVRRNKGRVSAEDRLLEGDIVRVPPVRVAQAAPPAPVSGNKVLPVVYEDESFLAIDKPAGLAVHGGSGVSFGVIEQIRASRPEARFLELVHRLDRETSGLLLIAKKKSALNALQDQFRERSTGKTYLALVKGLWPEKTKRLDAPLQKYLLPDGERRVRVVAPDHPQAQKSLSYVRVLASFPSLMGDLLTENGFTLLAVTIKTGRTHQIRVHLAHAGCPIVGDDKYGDFDLNKVAHKAGLRRMFLHAWRLQINHPVSQHQLQLEAKLPQNLYLTEFKQLGV
jgi:23S rRNA pseudouridine955/2504/2580 synthase